MPRYYILQGVRRCVASREAGKVDIAANIHEPGKAARFARLPLDQLESPKTFVLRDYRYIRYSEYPIQVMKKEPLPIDVEPLGLPGQKKTTAMAQLGLL
jgi:hypothetical protein